MSIQLSDFSITHGGIKPLENPDHSPRKNYGFTTNSQTAVRYFRFLRKARLDRLELPHHVYGRWVPDVPVHPAHLIISTLDRESLRWKTVQEIDIPMDERILGKGLSQEMRIEKMNHHFRTILDDEPRIFDLQSLETDHLRVECDQEHPVWPNHGENNGGSYNVPFGILNPMKAFGEYLDGEQVQTTYSPILKNGIFKPAPPKGMDVTTRLAMVKFSSPWLKAGFSLRRPMMMELGWDANPSTSNETGVINRLGISQMNFLHPKGLLGGLSGPVLRTMNSDYGSHLWTGEIHVQQNQVRYLNLTCGEEGLSVDAIFTIEPQSIRLELVQRCTHDLPVIEWETWRFLWDIKTAMTGTAAVPTLSPGRNGDINYPVIWAADRGGCLACQLVTSEPEDVFFQAESYREAHCITGGLVLASRTKSENPTAEPACMVIPKGERRATFELTVENFFPVSHQHKNDFPPVVQRYWASVFSCFRPEHGGFSNHAAAVNCHVNQHGPLEITSNTEAMRFSKGKNKSIDPLELMRFTIERALLDGGGYGYYRNIYLDSDPVLVASAGRIFQVSQNKDWLMRIQPGLVDAFDRMEFTIGEENLVICRDLSGDSGSFRWSSNAMDVVGFGHIDAYVNALSYRAFRNARAMFTALGENSLADQCFNHAEKIRKNYGRELINPKTGWVAGWRSRDGELHDYAFLWINATAISLGLLEPGDARQALSNLEILRESIGPATAEFGIPHNLLPIDPEDHILPQILGRMQPTFERYTDGALGAYTLNYYIRALSIYGFKQAARKLVDEFSEGLMDGSVIGGMESGVEFHTWEGLPSGYEGTFGPNFAPLYAIAIENGVIQPFEPEWWPPGG